MACSGTLWIYHYAYKRSNTLLDQLTSPPAPPPQTGRAGKGRVPLWCEHLQLGLPLAPSPLHLDPKWSWLLHDAQEVCSHLRSCFPLNSLKGRSKDLFWSFVPNETFSSLLHMTPQTGPLVDWIFGPWREGGLQGSSGSGQTKRRVEVTLVGTNSIPDLSPLGTAVRLLFTAAPGMESSILLV